jgi:excinuclease ABC subunit B
MLVLGDSTAVGLEVLHFPDWETLPYDNFSPHQDIISARMETLHRLPQCKRGVLILPITTLLHRLPPCEYIAANTLVLKAGQRFPLQEMRKALEAAGYQCVDTVYEHGEFAVRGSIMDLFPMGSDIPYRIELFDDEVESIQLFDPLTGRVRQKIPRFTVYPSSHYVTPRATVLRAVESIKLELGERLEHFRKAGKLVEAQRLEQRTRFDLEMLAELGFCKGIENYTRHLSGAAPGEPPPTLVDYLPDDTLMIIDESHVTVGQLGGMYRGDRSRKETLVDFGFRLPSAMDNRPLKFEEFEGKLRQCVFVSATPSDYEGRQSGQVVEQVVRPTGLIDPEVIIRPATAQVDDALSEIHVRVARGERVLVTTLTKRMAEDLTDYLGEHGVKVRYLHSDIDTVERVEIIRDLRLGVFDVLVGINLLREGLDIPEVSLVAILDADKEGFLRSERSLIQTIGRAARNINGTAILYADRMTDSIKRAVDETARRRAKQVEFNTLHGIVPRGVIKQVRELIDGVYDPSHEKKELKAAEDRVQYESLGEKGAAKELKRLEKMMLDHARNLEFEKAAQVRDQLTLLKERVFGSGGNGNVVPFVADKAA